MKGEFNRTIYYSADDSRNLITWTGPGSISQPLYISIFRKFIQSSTHMHKGSKITHSDRLLLLPVTDPIVPYRLILLVENTSHHITDQRIL